MKNFLVTCILMWPFLTACQEQIIVNESFDYPDGPVPDEWWSEGCPAMIKDGHLYVDADTVSYRVSTIWLDKDMEGDFTVEYDAHVVYSEDNKNNINTFLLYSATDGKPLRETREERADASYGHYHKLNGYIFTFLSGGNEEKARIRFRQNPGFLLIREYWGYRCRAGETYHVKIIKQKNRFQFLVDDILMVDEEIPDIGAPEKGLFGFRTFQTTLWWDNLLIKRIK